MSSRPFLAISSLISAVLPLLSLLLGCGASESAQAPQAKKPRPVDVRTLRMQLPPTSARVSASVASWKTEQIGFEVGGRIEWVAEPNIDIDGRVVDGDGKVIAPGTPVARIESERYQLQVEMAKAEVERAEQTVDAALIDLEKSLPSQLRSAEAEKKLAATEYDRSRRLFQQNAGAQSDVDRDEANYQTALSRIEQLMATEKAKQAELRSLRLQVEKARQSLRDAERSLEDCTLFSSFRGQVAEVSVVPGSVVAAGQAAVTVQMMDPIKIELEVSAEDSRRMRQRQRIAVHVPMADGTIREENGFLYLIDPVADPVTRTFTLTLLMMNEKNTTKLPPTVNENTPVTDQTWRLDYSFLPGAVEGSNYVPEGAVHKDDEGYFLWRINNFKLYESMPSDGVAKVSKLRIELGESKLPFLGNWVFQQVHLLDATFDSEVDMVAGKLSVKQGEPDDWNGDTILIDRTNQWMVRPGDLVKVDLSDGDAEMGYFVPMDAIAKVGEQAFLFVVETAEGVSKVSRLEVAVRSESETIATSSLMHVKPLGEQTLDGKQYVTKGVHYLRDGEPVKLTERAGDTP